MSVVRSQYVKELEGKMKEGKPFREAHKKAVKKTTVKPVKRKRSDQDKDIVKRVARKLYEIFYGPRAYSKKKFKPTGKRK